MTITNVGAAEGDDASCASKPCSETDGVIDAGALALDAHADAHGDAHADASASSDGSGSADDAQSTPFNGGATCDTCVPASQDPGGPCASGVDACEASAGCVALLTCANGCTTTSCFADCYDAAQPSDAALYNAINTCLCDACATQCASQCAIPDAGANPQDAGAPAGSCQGIASSTGTIDNVTPSVHVAVDVYDTSSDGIDFALTPNATVAVGDIAIELLMLPVPGQSSYANSPLGGCAVLQATSGGWSVIDTTQLCDLEFSELTLASAPGMCDGRAVGSFTSIYSVEPLGGTFDVPINIAWSQIKAPSCMPTGGSCSSNAECCDQSCSMYIGQCN